MVAAFGTLEITPRDPKLPCFWIDKRKRLPYFRRYQDGLEEIDEHLLPSFTRRDDEPLGRLRSFAICGMGGVGKTVTAIEYAYSRRDKFEAILWVNGGTPQILANDFAQLALHLGLEDDIQDFAASREVVLGWLSNPKRKVTEPDALENEVNWLLIFDNVDDINLIHDYWPHTGSGSVLVTSRDGRETSRALSTALQHRRMMNPMSLEEGGAFMSYVTGQKIDEENSETVSAIVERLGGLPLALHSVSERITKMAISYSEFLEPFKDKDHDGPPAIFHTFEFAIDSVPHKAKTMLQVLSLLDGDHIPEALLRGAQNTLCLPDYPVQDSDFLKAKNDLMSYSLISYHPEQRVFGVHRLVQDIVKSRMTETDRQDTFRTAIQLIISAWPFRGLGEHSSIERLTICDGLFFAVSSVASVVDRWFSGDNYPFDIQVARLWNDAGW